MEEYLRSQWERLPADNPDDWEVFERKLQRAIWWRRYQALAGLVLLLGLLTLGYYLSQLPPAPSEPAWQWESKGPVRSHLPKGEYRPVVALSDPEGELRTTLALAQDFHNLAQAQDHGDQVLRAKVKVPTPKRIVPLELEERSLSLANPVAPPVATPLHIKAKPTPVSYVPGDLRERGLKIEAPIESLAWKNPEKPTYLSPLDSRKPWVFSFSVHPSFTFRKFLPRPNHERFLHADFINAVEAAETHGFSINTGINASARIGAISYLNIGAEYVTFHNRATFNFTKFREAQVHPLTGEIQNYQILDGGEEISFIDDNYYRYLNLPVSISHRPWLNKHLRLNLEMGLSLMYFVGAQGKNLDFKTLEIIDLSQREYQTLLTSFSARLGVRYYLSSRINVGLEPSFTYLGGTIFNEKYPFRVVPYSAGVNLSLQMQLN